jgi:crotonobetainyl-CoA:carnitine CoA-transferase CaiB-like acyl-CoA transferase
VVQFMTGLAYMTGPPGRPLRAGSSVIDIMGGVMGDVAILAALRGRDHDGQGRKVTSALFESSAFLVAQHMAGEAASGQPVPPMPARESAWGIYETFDTADGEKLFIGITSDNHWRAFCEHFDRADLLADPRFATNAARVKNRAMLREYVADIARALDRATLGRIMDEAGIPFSPVNTPSDLFHDPQVQAHALAVRMPNGTMADLPPLPVSIDDATFGLRLQPPAAGEHTDAVLREAGYTADQVAALREAGIVG